MIRFPPFSVGWLLALLLAGAAPLRALEIKDTLWGFDGHVVPDCFNPLSVLVSNPESAPFDGNLMLSVVNPRGGEAEGADYAQPIALAPHTSQWVQFYTREKTFGWHRYRLQWGRGGKENYELKTPKEGPLACVWLRDTENPGAVAGGLESFPDALFPTTAPVAEGLDAMVLDHTPHWEPARSAAFLDWVRLGGTVHLLLGKEGQWPVLGEGLAALDTQESETRVGLGRVIRHPVSSREFDKKYLASQGFPERTIDGTPPTSVYDFDDSIFRDLSALTRPHVSWTLLGILIFAYVAIIGPVHNYYRRRLDYRVSIGAFLGCVGVFALGVGMAGGRSRNESQIVHSLAIAHSLGDGRADVTQWISAFAVKGDRYLLTHRAAANLYSPRSSMAENSSVIFNGQDGHILLDIPLFSSRAFLHRAILAADDTSVTVEKWEASDPTLRGLRLRTTPGFPPHPLEINAVYAGSIYQLTLGDGVLAPSGKPAEKLADYFSRKKINPLLYQYQMDQNFDDPTRLLPLLAARVLRVPNIFRTAVSHPTHEAEMQLLIVAPAPASFHLQGHGFTHENGWVLYVQDVFKP